MCFKDCDYHISSLNENLKQPLSSLFTILQFQVFIRRLSCNASLGSTVEETELEEIGLNDIHDRILLLADGGSNRVQTDRSAPIFINNCLEHSAVKIIQTKWIDL